MSMNWANQKKRIHKCLEPRNLPRLNHEEIENLNRPITGKKIEKFPTKDIADCFAEEFFQIFKELTHILLKLFQKIEGNVSKLISYLYNDTFTRRKCQKKEQRLTFLMNIDIEILNKILASQTQQNTKRIIHYDQVRFTPRIPEWFNMYKSINVIHHITKLRIKLYNNLNRCRKNI